MATITYANFIVSLRKYIEDKTGITSVWRYPGYYAPKEKRFVGIEFVNSVYGYPTKLNQLVTQDIYLNIAQYAEDVIALSHVQAEVRSILMNEVVPLLDMDGETVVGSFSISRIIGETNITDGENLEDAERLFRAYTDVKVELNHIRITV